MLHKLLQCPEWRPSSDEKSSFVQLSGRGNGNLLETEGPVLSSSADQCPPRGIEISPSKIVLVGQSRLTVCYNIASYVWETERNVPENSQKLTVYKVMWQFLWLIKFSLSLPAGSAPTLFCNVWRCLHLGLTARSRSSWTPSLWSRKIRVHSDQVTASSQLRVSLSFQNTTWKTK